jgi:serine/threonine-protein kinase
VLFELLTGVTAFDEPSLLELSAAILEREPVPLLTLRPDASQELEDVVLRCLAKNPDDRYQNVAELAIALYPFAPRRARISAERCYHMLKNAGVVDHELELASVHPPAMPATDSARVTASSGAAPRTTTPAAVDIRADTPVPQVRSSKVKLLVSSSLGLAAAAAGLWLVRGNLSAASAPVSAAPLRGVELPAAPAPSPAKPRAVDLDADSAAEAPSSAAASMRSATPRASKPAFKAPKPIARPTGTARRARTGDDELDPGF